MSTENGGSSSSLNIEKCSLVLVDVAGTTTSIGFVKEVLFPFVDKEAESFLKAKWEEEYVKALVKEMREEAKTEGDLELEGAVKLVKSLTEADSSNKGLKGLQGLIYDRGYESGDLKGHVFEDVPETFEKWAQTRRVAIYSTGSVASQKSFFAHTTLGDVSAHIFKYFDQSVGAKTEAESYKNIAREADVKVEEIVFLSDNSDEVKAAKSAGAVSVLVVREGNPAVPEDVAKEFTVISSFKDLVFDGASKRKIEEAEDGAGDVAAEAPPTKIPKIDPPSEPVKEAAKPDEEKKDEAKEETKTVTPTEETKQETDKEETMDVDAAAEKTEKPKEVVEEKKAEVEEDKEKEATPKTEETEVKTADDGAAEKKTEEKAEEAMETDATPTTTTEEEKPKEEKPVETEDSKPEEKAEEKEEEKKEVVEEEKVTENGKEETDKPAEETAAAPAVVEEKENNSVLANGNSKEETTNGDAENGEETTTEKPAENGEETSEVKAVKKLEETPESKTVSVEV